MENCGETPLHLKTYWRNMQSETKPRLLTILDIVTVVMLIIATGMVFFYAPMEAVMGQVQRVFYFHVSAAWVGMLGFLVAAIAGIAYLRTATANGISWAVSRSRSAWCSP